MTDLVPGWLGVEEYREHDRPQYPVTPYDANRELNVAVLVGPEVLIPGAVTQCHR